MKLARMDPSCCLGFLISSRQDFDRFEQNIQQYLVPVQNYMKRERQTNERKILFNYPMFVFEKGRLRDKKMNVNMSSNSFHLPSTTDEDDEDDDGIEDFVLI